MKLPGSARVRAARGYESKDAGERGVVLRATRTATGNRPWRIQHAARYAKPPLAVQRVMLGMLGLPPGWR